MHQKRLMELHQLLERVFRQECRLVGSLDMGYRVELSSPLTVEAFTEFLDSCKLFLTDYDIEIGSNFTFTQGEVYKIFAIQIKLPSNEKFAEKMKALSGTIRLQDALNNKAITHINLLMECGANINSKNTEGETPLHVAARMNLDNVIDTLLYHGASIDSTNKTGKTPLHIAAQMNHLSILEKLLARLNIDEVPSNKDYQGNTALHMAARIGNKVIMDKLLASGIDIESTNELGETPLLLAAYATNPSAVEFLLAKGANINHQDNEGTTSLHIAANDRNGFSIVKILLDNDADVAIKTKKGITALQIADQLRDTGMGKALTAKFLEQLLATEKPDFNLQELSEFWDERVKKLIDKSTTQSIEGVTREAEHVLETQKIKKIMYFFSDVPILQSPLEDSDEQMRENLLIQL